MLVLAVERSEGPPIRRLRQQPGCCERRFPVTMAAGRHPFPFRTRKLSPPAPMVLGEESPGRVGRRRDLLTKASPRPPARACFASGPAPAHGTVTIGQCPGGPPADPWPGGRAPAAPGAVHGRPALVPAAPGLRCGEIRCGESSRHARRHEAHSGVRPAVEVPGRQARRAGSRHLPRGGGARVQLRERDPVAPRGEAALPLGAASVVPRRSVPAPTRRSRLRFAGWGRWPAAAPGWWGAPRPAPVAAPPPCAGIRTHRCDGGRCPRRQDP